MMGQIKYFHRTEAHSCLYSTASSGNKIQKNVIGAFEEHILFLII